jgi:hypothetical protein
MMVLDTDHLNMLVYRQGAASQRLIDRMAASADQTFATTIVSVEEQMRGWLAEINRHRDLRRQLVAYERLSDLIDFWRSGRWSGSTSLRRTSTNGSAGSACESARRTSRSRRSRFATTQHSSQRTFAILIGLKDCGSRIGCISPTRSARGSLAMRITEWITRRRFWAFSQKGPRVRYRRRVDADASEERRAHQYKGAVVSDTTLADPKVI